MDDSSRTRALHHDLAIVGIAFPITWLVAGFSWLHYPVLLIPFLMLAAAWRPAQTIGIKREFLRYGLLAISIALLLYPASEDVSAMLPFPIHASDVAWVRCSQLALIAALGLAMWFEGFLLRRG